MINSPRRRNDRRELEVVSMMPRCTGWLCGMQGVKNKIALVASGSVCLVVGFLLQFSSHCRRSCSKQGAIKLTAQSVLSLGRTLDASQEMSPDGDQLPRPAGCG
jgi:hypothetical protein